MGLTMGTWRLEFAWTGLATMMPRTSHGISSQSLNAFMQQLSRRERPKSERPVGAGCLAVREQGQAERIQPCYATLSQCTSSSDLRAARDIEGITPLLNSFIGFLIGGEAKP